MGTSKEDLEKLKKKPDNKEEPPKAVVEDDFIEPPPIQPSGMTGAPPWIVTFADLTTLMLTFFVLLLSFANMDIVKFRDLMGSMSEAFGVQKDVKGDFQLVREPGEIANKLGNIKKAVDREREEKKMLADHLYDVARRSGLSQEVRIFYGEDGVTVRLDSSVVFDSGSADLQKRAEEFLQGIAHIMYSFKFNLFIEGHTDNVPISTRKFPSNWELSTVRATSVLRKVLESGVPSDRLAAVGYADRKPIRENNTEENRAINRRVEFKFIKVEQ